MAVFGLFRLRNFEHGPLFRSADEGGHFVVDGYLGSGSGSGIRVGVGIRVRVAVRVGLGSGLGSRLGRIDDLVPILDKGRLLFCFDLRSNSVPECCAQRPGRPAGRTQ